MRRRTSPFRNRLRSRLNLEQLEIRAVPSVLTPMQVRHAYGFDQITFNAGAIKGDGSGQTIAIVDAYNDPNIFNDLDVFDRQWSIEGGANLYSKYGSASSFLTKATPQGTPYTSGGWALEMALDVEWAHAIAPGAEIMLVEARSSSFSSLFGAVDYARSRTGVVAVSMSWGSSEFSGETGYDSHFTTPTGHLGGSDGLGGANLAGGVTFVSSSGDNGAPPGFPAISSNVLSVGGTTLNVDSAGNVISETGWSGSGGGFSPYVSEPSYQSAFQTTGARGNPDVSYNADPNTGFYVYDSVSYYGSRGWFSVGGTSAGSPQWAALVAIADQGRALAGSGSLDGPSQTLPSLYALASTSYSTYFRDITSGNNGYAAGAGWDPVTGLGSPIANNLVAGLAASSRSSASGPAAPSGGSGANVHGKQKTTPTATPAAIDANGITNPQPVSVAPTFTSAAMTTAQTIAAPTPLTAPIAAQTSGATIRVIPTTEASIDPTTFPSSNEPPELVPAPTPVNPRIILPLNDDTGETLIADTMPELPEADDAQAGTHEFLYAVELNGEQVTWDGMAAAVTAGVFLGCDLRTRRKAHKNYSRRPFNIVPIVE